MARHRRSRHFIDSAHGGIQTPRKFFYARRQPEIGVGGGGNEIVEYANVPQIIGALISNQMATLNELGTVYGVEDAYDMLEILAVDNHNRASMAKE